MRRVKILIHWAAVMAFCMQITTLVCCSDGCNCNRSSIEEKAEKRSHTVGTFLKMNIGGKQRTIIVTEKGYKYNGVVYSTFSSALLVITKTRTITKKYKGKSYRVKITEEGFLYQGGIYTTLEEVAYAISGKEVDGPTFFFGFGKYTVSISVKGKKANGKSWDISGGAPDPFMKLMNKNYPVCNDKYKCTWRFGSRRDSWYFEFLDEDLSAHDLIGKGRCSAGETCRLGQATVTIK